MKTAETIEAAASGKKPRPKAENGGRERSLANLIAPWTPETAPRNGGRPKKDQSQIIAKQVFENNPELIYKAFCKALAKGQAFAFQVLSDRAYGKLVQKQELTGKDGGPVEFADTDERSINERIARLERDLGLAAAIDDAGRTGSPAAGAGSTSQPAQDSNVLSR
jgi:hypothetical protein